MTKSPGYAQPPPLRVDIGRCITANYCVLFSCVDGFSVQGTHQEVKTTELVSLVYKIMLNLSGILQSYIFASIEDIVLKL